MQIAEAMKFLDTGLTCARSKYGKDSRQECYLLAKVAWIKWSSGNHHAARTCAHDVQRIARLVGDLINEARALWIEAMSCRALGFYSDSILLCSRARDLLRICGLFGESPDHSILITEAEVYVLKSEYSKAQLIYKQILENVSAKRYPYIRGVVQLDSAMVGVMEGENQDDICQRLDTAKNTLHILGHRATTQYYNIRGDLHLREGNMLPAREVFQRCCKSSLGKNITAVTYCLWRLGDVSRWSDTDLDWSFCWTVVLLGVGHQKKDKLSIHQALRFLGDFFIAQDDEGTAVNLFMVALDGFTQMDVHRGKGECLLRLGDISNRKGDFAKAAEFWTSARPMFELSSQLGAVGQIDERLDNHTESRFEALGELSKNLPQLNAPIQSPVSHLKPVTV
jgi:tetratricopeptide (TPR) repeat protein